jgi:hypothetical protein
MDSDDVSCSADIDENAPVFDVPDDALERAAGFTNGQA